MTSSFILAPNGFNMGDCILSQHVAPLNGRFDSDSSFVGLNRLPSIRTMARLDNDITAGFTQLVPDATEPDTSESKLKNSASRRERCRINQARYRKRQRQHADKLDESIGQLQQEIQDLKARRHVVERFVPTSANLWVVATDYFRHFRHGYVAPSVTSNSPFSSCTSHPYQFNPQLGFLQMTMVEDVTDGSLCGAEAILENWRLFTCHHGDVSFKLTSLEQAPNDSLLAVTSISFTITENALRHLYPHLIRVGDNGQEWSPLAARMLNQRIVSCGSVRFDWDGVSGRVARLESKFDVLSPMLKLLGGLEAVAWVFGQAAITIEGRILQHNIKSE